MNKKYCLNIFRRKSSRRSICACIISLKFSKMLKREAARLEIYSLNSGLPLEKSHRVSALSLPRRSKLQHVENFPPEDLSICQ